MPSPEISRAPLSPVPRRPAGGLLVAAALLTLVTFAFLARRFSPAPAWADASGYFNSAQLIAQGRLTTPLRLPPVLHDPYPYDFEPLGFHYVTAQTQLVPTYFVGLPLLLAAAHAVMGWPGAAYLLILGFGFLALLCTYALLGLVGVDRWLALALTANLAWSPVFVFGTTQTYSDTVATALCALAVLGVLKARDGPAWWCGVAGLSLGLGLLVRSTDVLLLPALLVLLPSRRGFGMLALGTLPFGAALVVYQRLVYGGAAVSGYGDIFRLFNWAAAPASLAFYLRHLPAAMPVAVLAPAALLPGSSAVLPRVKLALGLWLGAFGGFYAFYSITGQDWTFLRFIEPAFPALVALAGLGLRPLAAAGPKAAAVPGVTAGVLLIAAAVAGLSRYPNPRIHDRGFVAMVPWLRQQLPPDALVICEAFSGAVYLETPNPILRWDISATRNNLKYLREMAAAGQPVYAVLDQAEAQDPELRRKVPGRWEELTGRGPASAWRVYPPP